jgi:hypothetical protein
MTFDEARMAYPAMIFNIYAFEPGGPVVLETIVDGESFTFEGDTLQAALDRAFPLVEQPEPINAFE